MEHQKIADLLDNVSNQPSKIKTRNSVEMNDESRGAYTSNDIKFKTTMLRSSLSNHADAHILVKGRATITGDAGPEPDPNVPRTTAQFLAGRQTDERNKSVIFKNCTPFTKWISRINVDANV